MMIFFNGASSGEQICKTAKFLANLSAVISLDVGLSVTVIRVVFQK